MKKYIVFNLLMLVVATIFAQEHGRIVLGDSHISEPPPPPYDAKVSPPIKLDEAYTKALSALGDATNQYHCVSATCLNQLPSIEHGIGGVEVEGKGWKFEFSNTNGAYKHVHVHFDNKGTTLVGDGDDSKEIPSTIEGPIRF